MIVDKQLEEDAKRMAKNVEEQTAMMTDALKHLPADQRKEQLDILEGFKKAFAEGDMKSLFAQQDALMKKYSSK